MVPKSMINIVSYSILSTLIVSHSVLSSLIVTTHMKSYSTGRIPEKMEENLSYSNNKNKEKMEEKFSYSNNKEKANFSIYNNKGKGKLPITEKHNNLNNIQHHYLINQKQICPKWKKTFLEKPSLIGTPPLKREQKPSLMGSPTLIRGISPLIEKAKPSLIGKPSLIREKSPLMGKTPSLIREKSPLIGKNPSLIRGKSPLPLIGHKKTIIEQKKQPTIKVHDKSPMIKQPIIGRKKQEHPIQGQKKPTVGLNQNHPIIIGQKKNLIHSSNSQIPFHSVIPLMTIGCLLWFSHIPDFSVVLHKLQMYDASNINSLINSDALNSLTNSPVNEVNNEILKEEENQSLLNMKLIAASIIIGLSITVIAYKIRS